MEQELLTLPEHMSSKPVFCGVSVARYFVFLVIFCRSSIVESGVKHNRPKSTNHLVDHCVFLLANVLSVLRFIITPLVSANSFYMLLQWSKELYSWVQYFKVRKWKIFVTYSFQQRRKRHFYVVHRGPNVLFFTITADKFLIYVPIHRYGDFNTLQ